MIRVGIVGFGLSGRYLQAPFFLTNPNYTLTKIVTSQQLPKPIFGDTKRVNSIEDLLEDKEIDLISICSPNSTHFEYAKRVLNAGKHVLLEKPVSATAEQAIELYELAASKKLTLCAFQNRRFDSDYITTKYVINSGVLGDILSYEAHFDRYRPILNKKAWKEVADPTNGILYDLGAHLVDQAVGLFGKPDSFFGEVFTQRDNSNIDDAFNINLNFGKVKVNLKSSLLVKDLGPKYIIHGTLGSFTKYGMDVQEDHLVSGMFPIQTGFGIEPEKDHGRLLTHINGLEIKGTVETYAGAWHILFDNLADHILNGTPLIIKPEEVVQQIHILESIKRQL